MRAQRCVAIVLLSLAALRLAAAADFAAWEAAALAQLANRDVDVVAELRDFIAIPSVSAIAAHAADVRRAAEWTAAKLRALGAEHVAVMETGEPGVAHPVVYGDWLHGGDDVPTVLVYGHSDVQPAEPFELWHSPPFEATAFEHPSDGASLRGRGASDDKGSLLAALHGLRSVSAAGNGRFPVNLKFLLEAQEEIGSPQLEAFIAGNKQLLAADMALSADGDQHSPQQPSLTVAYRGAVALQIDVRTSEHDLHSGSFGGSVPNAAHVLARLLASLHTSDGAVAAPGFYDAVRARTAEERAAVAAVPFDEATDRATAGVGGYHGEPGYSTLERRWMRPTAEVTGVWSGWTGDGVKTVLPATAHARVVCRLVADQTPAGAFEAVRAHIMAQAPAAALANVTVTRLGFAASPVEAPADAPANAAAMRVLAQLYGKQPLLKRQGGSIPAIGYFKQLLGVDTTTFAFGHPGNGVHAPNEHFAVRDLLRGAQAWASVLFRLAEQGRLRSGGGGAAAAHGDEL